MAAIKALVERAEADVKAIANQKTCLGIGIPGSFCQHNHCVKNSNSTWLNGQPLLHDLESLLARKINIENDANCFVLSETVDGVAIEKSVVLDVIIGTGCGGGIAVDGKIMSGLNSIGGEWGHNPLPFPVLLNDGGHEREQYFDQHGAVKKSAIYQNKQALHYSANSLEDNEYPGPLCYCGKRGCIETWVSGTGFSNDYHRATGEALTAEAIIERVDAGEPKALACFDRYCERLAKSLAQVINVIDPDAIVLGGGMRNIADLYQSVPKRWHKYIFSDQVKTQLLKAYHGDSSGVRGAAFLSAH